MHAATARVRYFSSVLVLLAVLTCLQGCAALLLTGGAVAVMSAIDRRTTGAQLDDQNIELKAGPAIRAEVATNDIHVNVTSFNGLVLLSGETPTTEQRDKVLSAIRSLPGVRRIVNEITIAPATEFPSRNNDAWLTSKVKAKFVGVKGLESIHIKVVTENAVVYLMGLMKRQEADLATQAATEVGGVQRVVKLFEYLD